LFAVILVPLFALSLVARYRLAGHTERQQLKWLFLALALSAVGLGLASYGAVLVNQPPDQLGLSVYAFAAAGVPVAIAIAILRHNLYDIDRLISRTIGYAAITAVLAGVFWLVALSLGIVLGSLGEGQTIAVAGSTLLVAALFGPLRRRAQTIVDRRFDRSSYDAALTVQAMTARLRDDVDIDNVEADILGVLDRTFHPTSTSMWLRGVSR
jgi:divalent metal cation (Fe/Co/Zn/Cd) transporter